MCTGQAPEVTEAQAIQKAVASRMDKLDEGFLVALGAYIGAAEEQGDKALAGTLRMSVTTMLQPKGSFLTSVSAEATCHSWCLLMCVLMYTHVH